MGVFACTSVFDLAVIFHHRLMDAVLFGFPVLSRTRTSPPPSWLPFLVVHVADYCHSFVNTVLPYFYLLCANTMRHPNAGTFIGRCGALIEPNLYTKLSACCRRWICNCQNPLPAPAACVETVKMGIITQLMLLSASAHVKSHPL